MKRSLAIIIISLMSGMLFTGCGNSKSADTGLNEKTATLKEKTEEKEKVWDDTLSDAEKPSGEAEEKDAAEERSAGRSLAQRMAGKYSYHCSNDDDSDEFYIMDVAPFGDNLYAFCGQVMPESYESLSPYSFWVSEFIPYDADEVTSTDGDTVTVNELRFSVMSNVGKYWDAGYRGTITLTDDGLVFDGFDQEGFLVPDYDDSRLFLKDDRVENAFPYLHDGNGNDELEGLWMLDSKGDDLYIKFSGANMYMYDKDPGSEVFYAAGGCDYNQGSFDCLASRIDNGGMPFELNCDYKADGDTLTLGFTDPGDLPREIPINGTYKRVKDDRVHVTTMDEVELTSDSFGMYGGSRNYDELKRQDYYGVFVSSARSPEGCTPTVNKLEEAGFIREPVVYTPDFSELNPEPYYVVTAGLFTLESDAEETLAKVKKAGFTDAYVKYAGTYTGDKYWYTMHGGERIDVLKDGVMLSGVSLTIPYHTDEEPVTAYLLVTEDTVFDRSADLESFGNYEKGDTPYEWIVRNFKLMNDDPDQYQMYGPALSGVFEVGLDDNKVSKYYGSYWWD
ncbi:MAG: hypothetical protein K6E62_08350 [Lachnospiraceae bacterium]|nr:hypothetical protein [Lachnospiraceae bacterium]